MPQRAFNSWGAQISLLDNVQERHIFGLTVSMKHGRSISKGCINFRRWQSVPYRRLRGPPKSPDKNDIFPAGWCHPVIIWFINPMNYTYIYRKP